MKKILEKTAFRFVVFLYTFLNFLLDLAVFLLFRRPTTAVRKCLVFRVGNIGDTICATPAMVTIRQNFPGAKIILLTSPGHEGMIGAKELLKDVDFLDKIIIYYQEDIKTLKGKARIKRTMWSRRAQEYEAKINSGDLISIAEVVRDLYRSDTQPEQSYSERQLYESALDRMSREIAAVQKVEEGIAVQMITDILSKSTKASQKAALESANEEEEEQAA